GTPGTPVPDGDRRLTKRVYGHLTSSSKHWNRPSAGLFHCDGGRRSRRRISESGITHDLAHAALFHDLRFFLHSGPHRRKRIYPTLGYSDHPLPWVVGHYLSLAHHRPVGTRRRHS